MTDIELIQYMFLIAISLIFSTIGLKRETFISCLFASIVWFASALANYMLGTSLLQVALSYIFLGLGLIFTLASLNALAESISERNAERWKLGL